MVSGSLLNHFCCSTFGSNEIIKIDRFGKCAHRNNKLTDVANEQEDLGTRHSNQISYHRLLHNCWLISSYLLTEETVLLQLGFLCLKIKCCKEILETTVVVIQTSQNHQMLINYYTISICPWWWHDNIICLITYHANTFVMSSPSCDKGEESIVCGLECQFWIMEQILYKF